MGCNFKFSGECLLLVSLSVLPCFTSIDDGVRSVNLRLFLNMWPKPMGPLAPL